MGWKLVFFHCCVLEVLQLPYHIMGLINIYTFPFCKIIVLVTRAWDAYSSVGLTIDLYIAIVVCDLSPSLWYYSCRIAFTQASAFSSTFLL